MKNKWLILGLFFLAATVRADLKVWDGSVDLWSNDSNWIPAGVPAGTDTVEVASGMSVLLNGNGQCAGFEVSGSGFLIVNHTDRLLQVGGDGVVDGNGAELRVNQGNLAMDGTLVLTNGGTLVLDAVAATATVQSVDMRYGDLDWNAGTLRLTDTLFMQNGNPVSGLAVDTNCTLSVTSTNEFGSILQLHDGGTLTLNGGKAICDEFTKTASGVLDFKDGVFQVNGDGFDWDGSTLVLDGASAADCPTLVFNDFFLPITATLTNGISVASTTDRQGCLKVIEYSNLNAPVILGGGTGSTGMAIASNGATWTAGTLTVGKKGTGTLEILADSRVQGCSKIEVGKDSGSTGIVTVAGAGSAWSGYWQTQVGGHGDAVIEVSDGASLQFADQIGDTEFARYSGSRADITLSDPGSEFGISSDAYSHTIYFGLGGHASLLVSNGATASWDEFTTVGESSGSQGDITVTGSNSSWTVDDDLWLGYEGTGTLQVRDGASAHTDSAKLGEFPGGVGQVLISGAGSTWHGGGYECIGGEFLVGRYGTGEITVEDGGRLTSSGYSELGQYTGASGAVTVTGPGSRWDVSDVLYIGFYGSGITGQVTVADGGEVTVAKTATLFADGTLEINGGTGAGIFCANAMDLSYGGALAGDSNGILRVNTVTSQPTDWDVPAALQIGHTNGSSAASLALGSGESLTIADGLCIGYDKAATFHQLGGDVQTAGFTLGDTGSGSGTCVLSNGSLEATTALIGYHGTGDLSIVDADMTCHNSMYVADDAGSQGAVSISDGGSLSVHSLLVGQQGVGGLSQSSGTNLTHHDFHLGYWPTGNGAATLSGGSHTIGNCAYIGGNNEGTTSDGGTGQYTVSGGSLVVSNTLYVGHDGQGTLLVTNAGQLASASCTIGRYGGATGQVTVAGSDAAWNITGNLAVGDAGTGSLILMDGGSVSAGQITVGAQGMLSGNGSLSGDLTCAGTVSPGLSPGILSITGDVVLLGTSKLDMELAGTGFDALDVSGEMTLGGTLAVTLDGFTPALGDQFDLLDFASATGSFDSFDLPSLPDGQEWYTGGLADNGVLLVSLPADWLAQYGLSPTNDPFADPDGDSYSTAEEYTANTNPTNGASYFKVDDVDSYPDPVIHFNSSTDRMYTLSVCTNMLVDTWADVSGAGPRPGIGGTDSFTDTNEPVKGLFYYRLEVELP